MLPAVTPGEHPLRRIADAFHDVDPALDVEALVADRTAFAAAVDRLVSSGGRVVLFIDQAEDLISLTAPDQAADVAARLGAIERERLAVIFALRSASLDAWQRHPGLAGLTPDDPIWVNSLNRAGLREVILGPANVAGITFEPPELVERILDDTVDGYTLPLLAALLEELTKGYTREAPTVITTELYRRIGPVDRIIVRRAAAATGLIRADLRLGEEAAVNAYLRLVEIDDHGQAVRAEVAAKDLSKTDQKDLSKPSRNRASSRATWRRSRLSGTKYTSEWGRDPRERHTRRVPDSSPDGTRFDGRQRGPDGGP